MILVAGESLVDLVIDSSGGITPRGGGGPYNAARAVSRLGQTCMFLGRFSDDRFGRMLKSTLVADGVQLACPEPLSAPTTLALAEISDHGDASYHFYLVETAASLVSERDVRAALSVLEKAPAGTRAVHVGTLGLILEPTGTSMESLVSAVPAGTIVMLDPNCRPAATVDPAGYRRRVERLAARADIVKVSHDDLAFLYPGSSQDDAVRSLLALGASAILLTRGSRAAIAITRGGSVEVLVPQVQVADTIGAGDSFGGAFVAWWIQRGLKREDASDLRLLAAGLRFSTAVAAVTCQRVGAEPPRLDELDPSARSSWAGA